MPWRDPEKRDRYQKKYYLEHRDWYIKWHRDHRRIPEIRQKDAEYRRLYNKYIINMGGKKCRKVKISFNPRKYVCSNCGAIGKTHLHHSMGYFMILPWFGIQELCKSCHGRVGMAERPYLRRRNYSKRNVPHS